MVNPGKFVFFIFFLSVTFIAGAQVTSTQIAGKWKLCGLNYQGSYVDLSNEEALTQSMFDIRKKLKPNDEITASDSADMKNSADDFKRKFERFNFNFYEDGSYKAIIQMDGMNDDEEGFYMVKKDELVLNKGGNKKSEKFAIRLPGDDRLYLTKMSSKEIEFIFKRR